MPQDTAAPVVDEQHAHRLLVKPATAAELLDCTRQHVYELVARGQLRKVNIGRLARIPIEDVYRLAGLEPPAPAHSARRNPPRND